MMDKKRFQEGALAALPTVLGYASIGTACGIVSVNSGISALEMFLMSLLVYAGSSQFVMCRFILVKAPLPTIALTVFFINLRHFLMSLHVTTLFQQNSLASNVGIGTLLTDESYAVLLRESTQTSQVLPSWMYGNNIASYASWVIFTTLGNIIGGLIPNPERFGLDFALIAMFAGILSGQLEVMSNQLPWKTIILILSVVFVAYLGLASLVSSYLAVLLATLVGCFVGVLTDGQ